MAKNKKSRWIVWSILILLVCAGLGTGGWVLLNARSSATQYQTAVVARGELTQVVTATGQLNPVRNVQVGCQISGVIIKWYVDFNSIVKKDQVIADIDPALYQAALHQSEGDLANAQAAEELAQVNAKRSQQLFDEKLIAQSDYDQAIATLHQSQATVKIKEAALETARANLTYCTILSPVDGIVISRNIDVGQTVAASFAAPTLFVIANDLTNMQIDAYVAEADIGGVIEGQDVDFSVDAFPTRTFHGKVAQVRNSPITVQNVVTYDTVISVKNEDLKLRPGMTANVSIIIAHRDSALKIPNAALRLRLAEADQASTANAGSLTTQGTLNAGSLTARGTQSKGGLGGGGLRSVGRLQRSPFKTVYILTSEPDPKPKAVQVKTGITNGIYTEVEGLNEGDQVITEVSKGRGSASMSNPFGGPRRF